MPLFVWGILLTYLTYLIRELLFELAIGIKKVVGQLLDNALDVGGIGDLVDEIQSLLLDLEIMVLQTVCDSALVSLNCAVVDVYHLLKLVEGHVSYIVLPVHQESTKNVNS